MMTSPFAFHFLLTVFIFIAATVTVVTCSVTYDHRSIVLNGRRRILISGSIHYSRSVPEMWPDLFKKAKRGGLDVIQTYVFWNGHEPSPGRYYFEGRYDLVRFVKEAHKAGLYVHLRVGPYVCAEWNFGGFPIWLKYVHGISFRTNNGPFKAAMEKFTKKIVSMMKSHRLFESQGGPIILSQIENEYGPLESNARDRSYANWAAKMAVGLKTGVPWVMCKQDDAPDPVINTCNGFYCDYFSPNKNYKPTMWTENWTGWFTAFGGPTPTRPAEDLAFSVARFIQKGGSFVNYYMYHGGTNYGHTSGGPFIATSYDYDAPIDEYGLLREPKWGHLRDLHKAIKMSESALLNGRLIAKSLGRYQQSHVFRSRKGACAAFLANYDSISSASVHFGGMHHILPPWSISILPDCKNVVFNTARISTQHSLMKMKWVGGFNWNSYREELVYSDKSFTSTGLREQIGVTRDATDYLWYTTNIDIGHDELFLKTDRYPVLTVISAGHSLHVFINGHHSGMIYGSQGNPKLTYTKPVRLHAGDNRISLLSVSVGLPNVGRHFEKWNTGVLGPVILNGLNKGERDLTSQKWTYTIGLKGEDLNLHSISGISSVEWGEVWSKQLLTWHKAVFIAPGGNEPLALDMGSMGKGEMWINGHSIGRHWPGYKAHGNCGSCNYAGSYNEKKCNTNCGQPSQRWYHVPRSLLKPEGNLVVVFEEWGGNPKEISLVKRVTGSVCAVVSEWQPSMKIGRYGKVVKWQIPKARLWCDPGQKITSIKFASFGTPQGACGSFSVGRCHARNSLTAFRNCIGRQWCAVYVNSSIFGGDPCPGMMKTVSVEAVCE